MKDFSYITNSHPSFIENLYNEFLKDPNSIDPDIKKFFEGFDFAVSDTRQAAPSETPKTSTASATVTDSSAINWMKEISAYRMISDYRYKGHLIATTNPIRARKDRGAN